MLDVLAGHLLPADFGVEHDGDGMEGARRDRHVLFPRFKRHFRRFPGNRYFGIPLVPLYERQTKNV